MSGGAHLKGVDLRRRCACNCGCRKPLKADDLLLCAKCCEEPDAKRLAKLYDARVAARARAAALESK